MRMNYRVKINDKDVGRTYQQKRSSLLKKFISYFAAVLLFTSANAATAHNASVVTISAPSNDQTIIVESFPVNIIVEGTISHGDPGNINDQRACVSIDGGTAICEPNYVGGLGRVSSRSFSITVPISNEGQHTIQATTANSSGDHSGVSSLIRITVLLANVPCDEKDPPAYANGYLNGLNLPSDYATFRGQIIRIIANNHSNGAYGSCHYDYDAVREDVDQLLTQIGF
jgi:hypothetical protein